MELIGKRSVSSFLRIALTVIWSLGIVIGVMMVMFIMYLIIKPSYGMQLPDFSLDTDFIQVKFSTAVIKNPRELFLVFMPFCMIMLSFGMTIVYQLRKIFATLVTGNPFLLENAKRIRNIGLIIFGGVILEFIVGLVLGIMIMENVIIEGVIFSAKGKLDAAGIFIGLVMLVLAEIFRQGALLKEEQELTI